jgi:uncharacterized integral membrane protein (TIGR00698 family)
MRATADPYRDRELFRFVGSMEGVPEWSDPGEGAARGYALLERVAELAPGLALAAGLALLASAAPSGASALAILGGLALRNTVGLPPAYEAGLRFAAGTLLRTGVALLGIRLSVGALGEIGAAALPIAAACIAAALLLAAAAARAFGLSRRLGLLIAVGTAICGNSAIAATAPLIGAREDETSYAVGTITLFGLLALFVHPFVAHHWFGADARLAGLFLGTAIHDTAQVAAAGLLYAQRYGAPETLDAAALTKLVRNLFLLAVVPLIALWHGRRRAAVGPRLVPLFVVGFAALAALRTLGDRAALASPSLVDGALWTAAVGAASGASAACLAVAMAAIGLSTRLGRLRSLGLAPLAAGLAAALAVALVSAGLVHVLARRLLEAA